MVLLEGVGASPGTTDISGPKLLSNVPNRPGGLPSSLDGGPYRVRHVCSGQGGRPGIVRDGRGRWGTVAIPVFSSLATL